MRLDIATDGVKVRVGDTVTVRWLGDRYRYATLTNRLPAVLDRGGGIIDRRIDDAIVEKVIDDENIIVWEHSLRDRIKAFLWRWTG